MLSVLLALLSLIAVPQQDVDLEVTFLRATNAVQARLLIQDAAPEAKIEEVTFKPLSIGGGVEQVPTAEQMEALISGGAISVEVRSVRNSLAATGFPADLDSLPALRARSERPRYSVRIELPGAWATHQGTDLFASVLGAPAGGSKSANTARLSVASGDAAAVRERLLARPEVVMVEAR